MRRRKFLAAGAAGAFGMGLAGCSSLSTRKVKLELTPIDFETKVPKPKGTMPTGEIGKTGIKVSKFGFGSHIRDEVKKHQNERNQMVRDAYDLGINFFDVYEYESGHFQYESVGKALAPMINNVVISIAMWPYDGRTVEQEMERDLKLFGRDYIDLVRIYAWKNNYDKDVLENQTGHRWEWWETLFKLKEKGYIRAIGVPIHNHDDFKQPFEELPLDYVILPYNFYHNWTWIAKLPDTNDDIIQKIRAKGIGLISMKPLAGDHLVVPFQKLVKDYDKTGSVNYAKACFKYVINSGVNFDATLCGMYNPYHLNEDVDAFYNPKMTDEEKLVLKKIREKAKIVAGNYLPEHYKFLEKWVPDSWDDSDLFGKV